MRFPDHSDLGVITIEGVGDFALSMDRIGTAAPRSCPATQAAHRGAWGRPIMDRTSADTQWRNRDGETITVNVTVDPQPDTASRELDVERLAAAMARVADNEPDNPLDIWMLLDDNGKARYRRDAAAIIAALAATEGADRE